MAGLCRKKLKDILCVKYQEAAKIVNPGLAFVPSRPDSAAPKKNFKKT
jgi:hypothetical protein